jgi:hypothetical protein
MVSGMIPSDTSVRFEPYGSVGFIGQYFFDSGECGEDRPGDWPCAADDWSTSSGLLARGGLKTWLTDEYQLYVELDYHYDKFTLGAAINVVF